MEPIHENPKPDAGKGQSIFEKLGNLPKAIFGRNLDTEDLLIGALIFMLVSDRKKNTEKPGKSQSDFNLNGIKDFLGKLSDKEILALMLLYIMW